MISKKFYEIDDLELWQGDARNLDFIQDNQIQLIVCSPPYNVGLDYGGFWNDRLPHNEYYDFSRAWLKEAYRVLCKGGRLAVNVPAALTQSTFSKIAFIAVEIWNIAVKEIGFIPFDWIIWNKPYHLQGVTSWGSYLSQSSPRLRDKAEFIIIFCKEDLRLDPRGKGSDLTKEEFLVLTKNLWTMVPAKRKDHPSPFPLELPLRLIKLYCFPGDLVLDPFVGSGTTLLACKLLKRKGIGVDINPSFLEIAKNEISQQFLFEPDITILTKFDWEEMKEEEKVRFQEIPLFGENEQT